MSLENKISNLSQKDLRIDVGCGEWKQEGFIGIDNRKVRGVDIVHDLEKFPYPLDDECCKTIVANHLIEHIKPWLFIDFMNEIWRIAQEGCDFYITTPYAGTERYWQDPTHCNGCIEKTFHYFDNRFNLYRAYKPKPWKIISIGKNKVGDLEVILEKICLS